MNRLIIFVSSLGAVFLLIVVVIDVMGAIACAHVKEAVGTFLTRSRGDLAG